MCIYRSIFFVCVIISIKHNTCRVKTSLHLGPREIHGKKTIRTNSRRALPPVASSLYPVTFQVETRFPADPFPPKKDPNATSSVVSKTGVPSLPKALLI